MNGIMVVACLGLSLAVLFAWSFRHLPDAQWQILATFPRRQESNGVWRGVNLTYYGFFNALGVAAAVALAIFLAGTAGIPLPHLALGLAILLAVCIPASKIINRLVEGHWHGFTIGGASFAGIVIGPWLAWGIAHLGQKTVNPQEAVTLMGAMAPAYALGEGIGRLACISFGCCYGRPLENCPAWLQVVFNRGSFVFQGPLKKASYEHGFEGQRLIPVQGMTSIISSLAGLAGLALFLSGRPLLAYAFPIIATQVWRFVSEFLRADYRGMGRISAYQWMALTGCVYTLAFSLLWTPAQQPAPDVARGMVLLWNPGIILFLEGLAFFILVRMGISTVTTARITLDLRQDRPTPLQNHQDKQGT